MDRLTRRDFLKKSSFITTGLGMAALLPARSRASIQGANDTIRIGVIGFRGKGAQHINIFHAMDGVQVTALCDADQQIVDREAAKFKERGEAVDTYTDLRELLDDNSIDAVVTATPNHWHALVTVWACEAGKDVYVEKPVSHTLEEGQQMLAAARKYDRIVQSGTQRRSDPGRIEMYDYLRAGELGEITSAHCIYYAQREPIGKVNGPQPIPEHIDYDLWTGPAPLHALQRRNLHYDWHWNWTTGNGDLGNNGIHFVDLARWLLDYDNLPEKTMSIGGRFLWNDDGETPNTQITCYDYEPAPIIWEMRNLPSKPGSSVMDVYKDLRVGMTIECEGGYISGGYAYDNDGNRLHQFPLDGGAGHQANFIEAIRSRNRNDLNAEIADGVKSTALCHLGNISQRTGVVAAAGEIDSAVGDMPLFRDSWDRMKTHMMAHNLDPETSVVTLGSNISWDENAQKPKNENTLTRKMAEELYSRVRYRTPFELI